VNAAGTQANTCVASSLLQVCKYMFEDHDAPPLVLALSYRRVHFRTHRRVTSIVPKQSLFGLRKLRKARFSLEPCSQQQVSSSCFFVSHCEETLGQLSGAFFGMQESSHIWHPRFKQVLSLESYFAHFLLPWADELMAIVPRNHFERPHCD
jgi:hypothetical protein